MPGANRARWGWHCLDKKWASDIVQASKVDSRDLVLDVGAGSGALTVPLAATGARVIAIELHAQRYAELRSAMADASNVKVVRGDARDLWLPRRPFKVVANPPFSVTSDLLWRLLHPGSRMTCAHLVLQLQVARRLVSERGFRNSHVSLDVSINQRLPRSAFSPRPKVDVAVVHIHRRGVS